MRGSGDFRNLGAEFGGETDLVGGVLGLEVAVEGGYNVTVDLGSFC